MAITSAAQETKKDGPLVLDLLHSFGSTEAFESRGRIMFRSKDSVSNEGYVLQDKDSVLLHSLANDSSNLYFLKAVVSGSHESSLTFTRICSIFTPPLTEILTVNLDVSGKFMGISIKGGNPSCLPEVVANGSIPTNKRKQPVTTVVVSQTAQGPVPDTQSYLQRLEQDKIDKVKGAQQDNRSFLAKYWMYIVPVVIFMVIQSATNPEQGAEWSVNYSHQ